MVTRLGGMCLVSTMSVFWWKVRLCWPVFSIVEGSRGGQAVVNDDGDEEDDDVKVFVRSMCWVGQDGTHFLFQVFG